MCILQVAGDERFKSLLTSCIPELQSDHFTLNCYILRHEIYADRRLNYKVYTFFVGSNSLRIYLAIMELLPTFWSPTSTTLNFCKAFRLLENEIWSFINFRIRIWLLLIGKFKLFINLYWVYWLYFYVLFYRCKYCLRKILYNSWTIYSNDWWRTYY